MIIQKKIVTIEPIELEIEEITLLSCEEYEACKEHIIPISDWWWLRSPGDDTYRAAFVCSDGSVNHHGDDVDYDDDVVRPVVVVRPSESTGLQIGNEIKMAGYDWTMISPNMALCNYGIGYTAFRKDWKAPDANVYEKSDVKKWLENWAKENEIICC